MSTLVQVFLWTLFLRVGGVICSRLVKGCVFAHEAPLSLVLDIFQGLVR